VRHRVSFRALGLAFGLFAGGEDVEITETSGVSQHGSQVPTSAGSETKRLAGHQLIPARRSEPVVHLVQAVPVRDKTAASGVGGFVLQADARARQLGDTLLRWSVIREAGAYTVHDSVRLRIRGPTFTAVSKTVASIAEAAEPLVTGLGGSISQPSPPAGLDSRLSGRG
jgi:hypothetical protein